MCAGAVEIVPSSNHPPHLTIPPFPTNQVFYCDFGDLFFQRDPFKTFLYKIDADVIITEEGYDQEGRQMTILQEPTTANLGWVRDISIEILGDKSLVDRLGKMPVLNSGQLFGSYEGMINVLHVMSYVADLMDCRILDGTGLGGITSQGILNVAYYTGLLSKVARVKVLPPAASIFLNGCYYHPNLQVSGMGYDAHNNPLVNLLGIPYATVHQYNRWHLMTYVEEWLLMYGKIDWHFKPVGPADQCNSTAVPPSDDKYF